MACRTTDVKHRRGFTLLELLVVLAIVGLASAGITLSLRDSEATALERDATRLATLLEAARHLSRATGSPIHWRPQSEGFEFVAAWPPQADNTELRGPKTWLNAGTTVRILAPLNTRSWVLGPEPILPAQTLVLQRGMQQLAVGSDGFKPFSVQPAP